MLKHIYHIMRPFFTDRSTRRYAWGMAALLISLQSFSVFLSFRFNTWRGLFYDAIQAYNIEAFWHQFVVFCVLAGLFVLTSTLSTYFIQMFTLRWRLYLTARYVAIWHYQLSRKRMKELDNPDQRVQEDLRLYADLVASLAIGIFQATLMLFVFTPVLWSLSSSISFFGHHIPGLLWYISFLFTLGGSAFCFYVGRPIPSIQYDNQKVEADIRYSLISLRQGKLEQKQQIGECMGWLRLNYKYLYAQLKRFGFSSNTYFQIAVILPFLIAAPSYFLHLVTLGTIMQIENAFTTVNDSMSYLLGRFSDLTQLKSVCKRLYEFQLALGDADGK